MVSINNDKEALVAPVPKRRSVVVEPLAVLFLASTFPMFSITSQYMVYKVAREMGYDYDELKGNSSGGGSCIVNHTDPLFQLQQEVQKETAQWSMYKSFVSFFPGLIAPIILGSLADKWGRKILFVSPCIGGVIGTVFWMCIIAFDLPLWTILVEGIENFFGGLGLILTGGFAYLSDTVPREKLAFRMTILEVLSFAMVAVANLFVGYWIKAQGFFYPLIFVLVGKVLALLYGIFLVPETLKKAEAPTKKKTEVKDIFNSLNLLLKDNGKGRRWKINILFLSLVFSELVSTHGVLTLYLMKSPLCWNSVQIGYYSFVGMMVMSILILIVSWLPSGWITAEWKLFASRFSGFAQALCLGFATSSIMVYFAPILGSLTSLAMPMMRFILSAHVEEDERASAFALVTVVYHLGMFVSSMTTTKIYMATLYIMNGGLVFLIAAGVIAISLVLLSIYMIKTRGTTADYKAPKTEEQSKDNIALEKDEEEKY